MASQYHEPPDELSQETRDRHRALSSVMEEFEAVDWYQHRIDATRDDSLKALLVHNRNEEFEHAAMGMEWLRRRIPEFDQALRTYLFTTGAIHEIEEDVKAGQPPTAGNASPKLSDNSLSIGKFVKG